jgi:hypothetical protein
MITAPETHDAIQMFRDEADLVRRLVPALRAEAHELFSHREQPRIRHPARKNFRQLWSKSSLVHAFFH